MLISAGFWRFLAILCGGDYLWTPRKEKALQALFWCRTKAEAAQMAGIGESTLRTYFRDPEFMERYREEYGELLRDATRQAQQDISAALDTLSEIMGDAAQLPTARISAARSLLEYSLKLTEQVDILEKLEELERWRQQNENGR